MTMSVGYEAKIIICIKTQKKSRWKQRDFLQVV